MKRTLSFMVMALALLLTQCRKPEVKFPTPSSAEGVTVSMTVTAGPGSKTDITDEGAITWSKGDKLYVGFDGKYVGCLELVGDGGSATGTFRGTLTLDENVTGGQQFRFFYLGSTARELTVGAEAVIVSFAEQTGLLNDLGSCHIGYGTAQGTVADSKVTGINVTLVSKVALACFSFKKSGTSEGYSGALTLSGNNIYNSMTVNFNGTLTGTKTDGGEISLTNTTMSEKYVMLVPAGAGSATLNFGGEYEGATTLAQGIEANKYYGQGGSIEVVLTKAPVPVTGVTVDPTELNLVAGGTSTLTATVTPENADDKSVTWRSSNESVATVSDAGVVTAVAEGTATITVTATNGTEATDDDKTAECAVTVTAAPTPAPVFTVNKTNGTTVTFAPGNLYYDGTADKWKFESNQWDFRTYGGRGSCIDGVYSATGGTPANDWGLFGWSTGAANNNWGMHTQTSSSTGYTGGNFKDWGGITDLPDNAGGKTWRTLSKDEWMNLLDIDGAVSPRDNAASLRALVTLDNGIKGLVILPDGSTVTANTVTTTALVASSGAVFLPAAGFRTGTGVLNICKDIVTYWSSTPDGTNNHAYRLFFKPDEQKVASDYRMYGFPVRLVKP